MKAFIFRLQRLWRRLKNCRRSVSLGYETREREDGK